LHRSLLFSFLIFRASASNNAGAETSDNVHSNNTARLKKFENVQISFSSASMSDPRGVRIKKILDSNVLELQLEKQTLFNVVPSTKYDMYMESLRQPNALVKQMGVPVDSEKRDMEVNTDAIDTKDQSVQFCYGDDTGFYKIIDAIKRTKSRGGYQQQQQQQQHKDDGGMTDLAQEVTAHGLAAERVAHNGSSSSNNNNIAGAGSAEATRLTTFLQRASNLCENLLSEQREQWQEVGPGGRGRERGGAGAADSKYGDDSSRGGGGGGVGVGQSVLDAGGSWVALGSDGTQGANEPVRSRKVVSLRYSALQPSLLVAAYPFPTDEEAEQMDLKPYKVSECTFRSCYDLRVCLRFFSWCDFFCGE
jgi:hypothetical protein